MIWAQADPLPADTSALQTHLQVRVADVCGEIPVRGEAVREAARAVAQYCLQDLGAACVPDDCLEALMSRSLAGAGEVEAAEVLLARGHGARMTQAAALMLQSRVGAAWAWKACATRLVRTSQWSAVTVRDVWVLDLDVVSWSADDGLELALFGVVRGLIERMADVWEQTGGQGWLGLRGLARRAGMLLQCGERSAAAGRLAAEVRRFGEQVLRAQARRRGWADCPGILNLDL
ncbi:MAG: hypothetical protein JXB04_06570 [Kiritimatiellae bacterium]|nr:hypothetical protein [Kiritimatiellia bacterium]